MKICIAVPSRGRARIMWKGRDISLPERLCRTAFDTAKDPDNVIIKYYINDDDESLEQYNIEFEPLLKKYEGNLIVETGPDQSTVQSWNKIYFRIQRRHRYFREEDNGRNCHEN